MKWLLRLAACLGLSSCVTIYHPPVGLTQQTSATITGIYHPSGIIQTGTHICLGSVDNANLRYGLKMACDQPVLITPGAHVIGIMAEFHPWPEESGYATVTARFEPGQAYFIRANGGPVAFLNTNGVPSLPASGLTVWVESASGVQIVGKTMIALQGPPPVPLILFVPGK